MRFVIALLATFALLVGAAAPLAATAVSTTNSETVLALDAQQAPTGRIEVDIDTDNDGGAWYMSPVWIAIGAIALIVLILLIVTASRGGGTTVVRG